MNARIENLLKLDSSDIAVIIADVYKKNRISYLTKIKDCSEVFSEHNVHVTRVAIRRLLAVLNLAEKFAASTYISQIRIPARKQLKVLAGLRDIQVVISKTEKELNRFPNIEPFMNYLLAKENAIVRNTTVKFKKIDLKVMEGVSLFLQLELQDKIRNSGNDIEYCKTMISQAHSKVLECTNRIVTNDFETVHDTRIAFKKFRYLFEFFVSYLDTRPHINKRLNAYQTKMGMVQDLDVYINELEKFIGKAQNIDKAAFAEARKYFYNERRCFVSDFIFTKDEIFDFWAGR